MSDPTRALGLGGEVGLVAEVRAALEAASPGPWFWAGNLRHGLELRNREPGWGHCTVMAFARHGMQGGQPVFHVDHMLHMGIEFARREVPYREDVADVEHPDAQLIKNAPAWLKALCDRIEELEGVLQMVKADRPSAHSDRVWAAILDAVEVPDAG